MCISTKFPRCIFDIGIFNVFSLQLSLSWGSLDLVSYWPNFKALIHRTLFWVKSILMLTHFSKEFWQSVCLSEVPLDCVLTRASESLNNRTLGIAIISINSDMAIYHARTESNCFAMLLGRTLVGDENPERLIGRKKPKGGFHFGQIHLIHLPFGKSVTVQIY